MHLLLNLWVHLLDLLLTFWRGSVQRKVSISVVDDWVVNFLLVNCSSFEELADQFLLLSLLSKVKSLKLLILVVELSSNIERCLFLCLRINITTSLLNQISNCLNTLAKACSMQGVVGTSEL